jgi:branched-chain amino acid transport system substrate-binding protein
MRLSRGLILLVIVASVAGFFFLSVHTSAAAEAKPINVGVTEDFSGVSAPEGTSEFPAFEMAIKEINAAGGVNGRPIKLFVVDNGGDPTKTVGTLKMHKELNKCVVIFYGYNSAGAVAAKAWAEQSKVPVIASGPLSDKLVQKEGKAWLFRSYTTNSEQTVAMLKRVKEMGLKKFGYMATTQAFGTDMLDIIQKTYSEHGVEFVGYVLCEPGSKDLTIQAMKLRDAGAEVVLCQNYVADQIVWARNLKTIGWKPVSITGSILLANSLEVSAPELWEDWQGQSVIDLNKPIVKTIWDNYAKYTGKRHDDDKAPRAWDAARILVEAIRLSGNPDSPEAIRDGFYKIKNFAIATGRKDTTASFEIGRNFTLAAKDISFVTVKSGKFVMPSK